GSWRTLVFGVICLCTRGWAADLTPPEAYEGRPVAAVRWDPPTQPVARADLARLLPIEPGAPLHLTTVREAIKKLYATGDYSNIQVEVEPAGKEIPLVIRTPEQWFAGPVQATGKANPPPPAGQLANATRLELGTPFDDSDLKTASEGVRNLLER